MPDGGCCTLGAHFSDKDDRTRVAAWAEKLSPEDWQYHDVGIQDGIVMKDPEGSKQTRVVDGACLFLNRPDFDGPTGCALHALAIREGVAGRDEAGRLLAAADPADFRQRGAPGRHARADGEHRRVRPPRLGPGGHDLNWYCSSNTEAHVAAEPVYITERDALVELMGTPPRSSWSSVRGAGEEPQARPGTPPGIQLIRSGPYLRLDSTGLLQSGPASC